MKMTPTFENTLVSTQWLSDNLEAQDLRILDCTTHLRVDSDNAFRAENAYPEWEAGHIPGAMYVDLQGELSDKSSAYRFMLPSAEQFGEVMGKKGVGPGTRVVLYSGTTPQWAARIWWMLRSFGFEGAMILDGGFPKWVSEGRPVSTEISNYPSAIFQTDATGKVFVGKEVVVEALGAGDAVVLNALLATQHRGIDARHYGRPGRIAGSVNVPANNLIDPETGTYLPQSVLREQFRGSGALEAKSVVNYCGGGIAASSTALILALLGQSEVSIYDASLSEWARDESAPMETG